MQLLITVFLIFITVLVSVRGRAPIPACPDLSSLPNEIEKLDSNQLSKLKCFCSGGDEENLGINVNCIFGSRLGDLMEALNAIDDVNGTVFKISLDHIEVSETEDAITLEEALSSGSLTELREFEIKECRGGILIEHRENPILEFPQFPNLESIVIENCELESIPSMLLSKTSVLRILSLMGNKVNEIKMDDLTAVKQTLEHLDLTSNVITKTEPQAISQLKTLKTLLIGEHNFGDESLLQQIGQLPALEKLNMTRMDGVESLSTIDFIAGGGGKSLQQWSLTGCNLKALNNSDFLALENLQELDLRVNLLENIEAGTFEPLKNLRKLSLAGNFLNETNSDLWKGLEKLDSLDLGWNEFSALPGDAFSGLGSLTSLSLRHNEKLEKINVGAFRGLHELQFLNLSGTTLTQMEQSTLVDLVSLEEIHLSFCNIQHIEAGTFDAQNKTLRKLSLNGNKLRSLHVDVLKELYGIEEINLSANPYLCDQNIKPLIEWVRSTYKSAAEASRPFFLMDSRNTTCDRPYSKKGLGLLELSPEDLTLVYNESLDTTTPAMETTTVAQNDFENFTTINFEDIFHVVGNEGNDTLDAIEDAKKPTYDINRIKFGQKTTSKNPTNSMFATIAVSALVIITVISILLMVRHRRVNNTSTRESPVAQDSIRRSPKNGKEKSQNGVTTAV